MSQQPYSARYDTLQPHPAGAHVRSDVDSDSMDIPNEDLDFDLPPGAGPPRFYNADFGGPQPNPSYNDSFHTLSRQPSEASFAPFPAHNPDGRGSSLSSNPFHHPYQDDPSQVSMVPLGRNLDFSKSEIMEEKRTMYGSPNKGRRKTWLLVAIPILLFLIGGATVAIYFGIVRPKQKSLNHNQSSKPGNSTSDGSGSSNGAKKLAFTGADGSMVTMNDGSTFQYSNSFGGFWYYDPDHPFVNNAQAQSYTPPLNHTFKWGQDHVHGVNLGGWLVLEPFISPSIFQKYNAVDEWTLCEAMANDTAGGGLSQLEDHYKTFITERDFADIASYGLNFVRIPLGYWVIEVWEGEPFLPKVSWKYFLMAIEWARKYGIRINLDFHALPGSQNGWNHSGRLGSINVLNGVMGLANAQRSLSYIRMLAEFISQPQYKDVVVMFGVTNEPQASVVGMDSLLRYYLEAYNIVRTASGIGEGKGPVVSIHDGFQAIPLWANVLPQADRVSLDTHPYFAFGGQSTAPIKSFAPLACQAWGGSINTSMSAFGMTVAGEFSLATNDCGLFVNGVGLGSRYDGTFTGGSTQAVGSCDQWNNWESFTAETKQQLKQFAMSSMDALQNYFFWTWKIGKATDGTIQAPFWSYQLGVQNDWIPQDPRLAIGACGNTSPWSGPLAPWQTGGAGAGNIPSSVASSLAWPPPIISAAGPASLLPQYTPTGTVATLPVAIFTPSASSVSIDAGSGWANPQDTGGANVPISGCPYLDPWSGVGAPLPTAPCTGSAAAATTPALSPTPAGTVKREPAPARITKSFDHRRKR